MNPSFSSSQNLWPISNHTRYLNRDHIFINVLFQNQRYRLRTKDYLETNCSITMWMIFWFCVTLSAVGHILEHYLPSAPNSIMFGFGTIGSLVLAAYVIRTKLFTRTMLQVSVISLSAYLFCCWGTSFFEKILLYPTLLYIIVETLGSIAFLQNKNHLFGKFLIFQQLILLVLKNDELINTNWEQTLFGFLLGCYFCLACIISMASFLMVNIFCFLERLRTIKHIGIIYLQIQTLGFLFFCGVFVFEKFYPVNLLILPSLLCVLAACNAVFTLQFRQEVVMFFCRIQKINCNNQIITLIQIDDQKLQDVAFVKKSDNWYGWIMRSHVSEHLLKAEKKMEVTIGEEKCLICLEEEPNVVWMPCGHLCICENCCLQMFEHKTSSCLLCKNLPEAIYVVSQDPQNSIFEAEVVVIEEEQTGKFDNLQKQMNIMYPYKGCSVKIC